MDFNDRAEFVVAELVDKCLCKVFRTLSNSLTINEKIEWTVKLYTMSIITFKSLTRISDSIVDRLQGTPITGAQLGHEETRKILYKCIYQQARQQRFRISH